MKIITKLLLVSIIASSAISASPFTAIKQAAARDPYVATSFALSTALIGIGSSCMYLENKEHQIDIAIIKTLLENNQDIPQTMIKTLSSQRLAKLVKSYNESQEKPEELKAAIISLLRNTKLTPQSFRYKTACDLQLIGFNVGLATLTYLGMRAFFTYIQGNIS